MLAQIVSLIVLCAALFAAAAVASSASPTAVKEETKPNGLKIITTHVPDTCTETAGKTKNHDKLFMHYTGYIDESSDQGIPGRKFDSSGGKKPFTFFLGAGRVIQGWDQGLLDMCTGEKRTLIIPPELGYGDQGAGVDIPPGATIKFDVELIHFVDSAAPKKPKRNIFAEMDADNDNYVSNPEFESWFTNQNMDIPRGVWEKEDKDGDRKISLEEFSGPKGEL
jgi:hypothetical protein